MPIRTLPFTCVVSVLTASAFAADVFCQEASQVQAPDRRTEILRRLDRNGDGVLQPDEIPQRAKSSLDRAAQQAGLQPGEPIVIDKLVGSRSDESENANHDDAAGDDRDDRRRRRGRRRRSDRDDEDSRSESQSKESESAPPAALIRGFGEEINLPPVPGFGAAFDAPSNQDGKPSADGAAAQQAQSKAENNKPEQNRSGGGRESSNSDAKRVRDYARGLISKYDQDGDGVLEQNEMQNIRGNVRDADRNGDGNVTLDELTAKLSEANSNSGGGDSKRKRRAEEDNADNADHNDEEDAKPEPEANDPSPDSSRSSDRRRRRDRGGGKSDRLIEENDADGDGQVAMHEFTSRWTDSKVDEFRRLDVNGDGYITRDEVK